MKTTISVQKSIQISFPNIVDECRSVLGSELHYQAMVYHILRTNGNIPLTQMGMNVKTCIEDCQTKFFQHKILKKNEKFQSEGIEIIPDISIYEKTINSDWRRRNYKNTLEKTLYSLEIKASERHKNRLRYKEIETDLLKLKAQYDETFIKFQKSIGIGMLIIDTAPTAAEQMKKTPLNKSIELAKDLNIDFWYFNQKEIIEELVKS